MPFTRQAVCRRRCAEKQAAAGTWGDLDSSRRAATHSLCDLRQAPSLDFPNCPRRGLHRRGGGGPRSGALWPEDPPSQVPQAGFSQRARDLPEATGPLWEAWKKPWLVVWLTLPSSLPQFPHLSNGKGRSRETVPPDSARLIPGGVPASYHGWGWEAGETRTRTPSRSVPDPEHPLRPRGRRRGSRLRQWLAGSPGRSARRLTARAPAPAPASVQPTCPGLSAEPLPSPLAAGARGFRAASRDAGAPAGAPGHVSPLAVAPLLSRSSGTRRRSTTWRPVVVIAGRAVLGGPGAWDNGAGRGAELGARPASPLSSVPWALGSCLHTRRFPYHVAGSMCRFYNTKKDIFKKKIT